MGYQMMNKSSAVVEMGDRLAKIDVSQKVWGLLCPLMWGGDSWVPI